MVVGAAMKELPVSEYMVGVVSLIGNKSTKCKNKSFTCFKCIAHKVAQVNIFRFVFRLNMYNPLL